MSKVLAIAGRLRPEIRLAQAISQFEADLSGEQKTSFRDLKAQTLTSPPDSSDVMLLTAEFDRCMTREAGRRCIGPRFTNFLQGVQQFAALGDVVVGGSQNIIACSIWSLVRMSLLSIINFASYYEKLSTLFMDIGRSAPRYQTMSLLYPQSKSLQSQLNEYFIVVVNLCHCILNFTRKSTLRRVTSTLNDSELTSFQTDLRRWACSIKEEIQMIELRENVQSRALFGQSSRLKMHQEKLAKRLRILDLCSKYDYETSWKQARKVGNAAVFAQLEGYQDWKETQTSSTYICTGKLGSGKSVLLANIVDDLNIYAGSNKITVAYFFCRHDVAESLQARTIIGSLARQLLQNTPDLHMLADVCDKIKPTENIENLFEIVSHLFKHGHSAYFVLDGLDECIPAERLLVIQELQKIQKALKLLLIISWRIEPDNGLTSIAERLAATRTVAIPENNPDIETYMEEELKRSLETRNLVIGDPILILEICNALSKGSQGMFLWVALQIRSLWDMKTDQAIRDALADLPKDLSETFFRILRKHKRSGPSYQVQILQLVLAAYRPLTVAEMREALSVIPGDNVWNPSQLLNGVHSVLSCCGGLIIVDEEEATIRFVHHSVKQFILNDFKDPNNQPFTFERAQRLMADTIVTYLNYGIFGTELSRTRFRPVMLESAPSSVIRTAAGPSMTAQNLALKLLTSRKTPSFDVSKTLAEARRSFQSDHLHTYRFHSYATKFWQHHILYTSGQLETIGVLSRRLLNRLVAEAGAPIQVNWKSLAWGAKNGNKTLAKLFIDSGKLDIKSMDENGLTPLFWTVRYGHEALAEMLLDTDITDIDVRDRKTGRTPLSWASERGQEMVVKRLLDSGKVDVNARDLRLWTPLLRAIDGGNESITRLLLNTSQIDADATYEGLTPLSWAARKGSQMAVALLLGSGKVNILAKDLKGQTPLSHAAQHGHEGICRLLLLADRVKLVELRNLLRLGADSVREPGMRIILNSRKLRDVHAEDQDGRKPISWAAQYGHKDIVKLLLTIGKGNVLAMEPYCSEPLVRAVSNGHDAVARLLLGAHNININYQDRKGLTPLSHAVRRGDEAMVKLLLSRGLAIDKDGFHRKSIRQMKLETIADIPDLHERTALSYAVEAGHESIVILLLNTRICRVNEEDDRGLAPLIYAIRAGNEAMVRLLLTAPGIDVNVEDENGDTAMTAACRLGHEEIFTLLRDTEVTW